MVNLFTSIISSSLYINLLVKYHSSIGLIRSYNSYNILLSSLVIIEGFSSFMILYFIYLYTFSIDLNQVKKIAISSLEFLDPNKIVLSTFYILWYYPL